MDDELSGRVIIRSYSTSDKQAPIRSISAGSTITTSTTCSSSDSACIKEFRSLPCSRIQTDSTDVKMHALGLAYIQMNQNGYLELVSGEYKPDNKAAFEVVEVQAASQGKGKIFRLRNVEFTDFYLTGHIDSMTVDGIKDDDDTWSQWTATKVQESKDVQHCFKLQVNAKHYAQNWYFYIKDKDDERHGVFKIGEPRGFDVFQIETT